MKYLKESKNNFYLFNCEYTFLEISFKQLLNLTPSLTIAEKNIKTASFVFNDVHQIHHIFYISFFPLLGWPRLWTSSVWPTWKGWPPLIVIRYYSVWRANQELVRIHNDAAHKELVKIYNRLTSWKISSSNHIIFSTNCLVYFTCKKRR